MNIEHLLTDLEKTIHLNKVREAEKMVDRSKKKAMIFTEGEIFALAIPKQPRIKGTEPKCMVWRILVARRGLFTLLTAHGEIFGLYSAAQINKAYGD
jgi:hypothetical protein